MSAVRAPAEALVPVHSDVQFRYTTSFAALGGGGSIAAPRRGGGGGGGGGGGAGLAQERGTQEDAVAQRPALEEVLDEFISFDAPIEEAAPKDQQPPAAAAAAGGMANALLDDYVSMGLIADPAAVAAAKTAPPRTSSRPEQLQAVPWVGSLRGIRSPLLRLHQEVVEFCRYLAPSPSEQAARQAAIDSIEEVVTSIWPKARVEVFGSFATGLYLPTSDVDAVVMGSGCTDIPQGLKALATALARRNMAKNMQVIAKAKVPIVKFEDAGSGYNFDLSFDVANGPEAAENVRALMDSLPPMRPLVMVLKVFLQQRELNEVYSGGLGSYALLVMVAAFLQLHPSRQATAAAPRYGSSKSGSEGRARELEGNLGVLLADFFRLYGRALNNTEVGVSCRKGGSYYNKRTKGFFQAERPFLYSVEDPNDQSNDLGRNSYNISRVRMAFDWAYCQLTAPSEPGVSLLQRIIRLDPVLFARVPPPPLEDDEPATLLEDKAAKKKKKKKTKGNGEKQRVREVSEEAGTEEADEAEEEEEEGRQRQAKRHKRRHRERSLSDSDQGGRRRGAAARGRHRESDSDAEAGKERADDDVEESSSSEDEEERRRQHKKHRHKHHGGGGGSGGHHHKHSGGSGTRRHEEGQHHRRHSKGSSGGGSRHVYFD